MKTSDLSRHSHDIHENEGGCGPGPTGRKQRMRVEKGERPMSRESKPNLPNVHANEMNAPTLPEGSTPEAGVTPAVARFPAGDEKKMLKKYVRSRNVYENKQISDTMPEKNSDIYGLDSDIYV
jgi:hypothetical protein